MSEYTVHTHVHFIYIDIVRDITEMTRWCRDNIGPEDVFWHVVNNVFIFDHTGDAVAFQITFRL